MEIKWIMISTALIFTTLAIGHAVEDYSHNQCKQVYAVSNKPAEDILKICGK